MTRTLVNALWSVTGATREPAELDAVYVREGCWTLDGRAYEESGGTITLRLARATEAEVWQAADLLLRTIATDEHRRVGELVHVAATRHRALAAALAGPRGLALLTPPLCCDPDVHALYTMATTFAEFARVIAPGDIDDATTLDALHRAVRDAFLAAHEDASDAERSRYAPRQHAGRSYARAAEYLRESWEDAIAEVIALERGPVAVREVPAVAGPHHVDACGREVTP